MNDSKGMNLESDVVVFTDGASRGNPGPGGFGAIVVKHDDLTVTELGSREENTTNNRMELAAAIKALSFISNLQLKTYNLQLFTDSLYLINGITKWVHGWQKNNWRTKEKKEVLNKDLWEQLIETSKGFSIDWKYIAGHAGSAGNERTDEIATAFADGKKPNLYNGPLENYPVKNILDISPDALKQEKRDSQKSRSKARGHSYVSCINGEIKTHKTWAECEARVKGRSGAKYKKALSPEEEREIIDDFRR